MRSCSVAGRRCRRREHHDDRGALARQQAPGANRLARRGRAAMRLLPVGPDHGGGRLSKAEPAAIDADIDTGITNICRCGTYPRIRARDPPRRRTDEELRERAMDGSIVTSGAIAPPVHRHRADRRGRSRNRHRAGPGIADRALSRGARRLRPARTQRLAGDRARRHDHHPLSALGDGAGQLHRAADDGRRGTRMPTGRKSGPSSPRPTATCARTSSTARTCPRSAAIRSAARTQQMQQVGASARVRLVAAAAAALGRA